MIDYKTFFKTTPPPPLTPAQEKSPFAQFYYEPVNNPSDELLAAIETQMPVEEALDFKDIERIFLDEPGIRNGWCILPDGTAFSSIETKMPDVTPENEAWWGQWMMDPAYDYLNYRIWMPGLHVSHAMPIIEDLGWGTVAITMFQPLFPPVLLKGKDPKELNENFIMVMGASGYNVPVDDPDGEKFYSVLISCVKKDGEGIKVQTVNYIGMKWEDGKLVKVHDVDPVLSQLFFAHNVYEFHHKKEIAKKLYDAAEELPNRGLNSEIRVFPS